MSAKTIKGALGLLQDDPDNAKAWQDLRAEIEQEPGMDASELGKLLEAARRAYESRREYEAIGRVLSIEADVARGTAREIELLRELARVLDEDLLDDEQAGAVYARLSVLRPDDPALAEAGQRSEAKRAKWSELVDRYVHEAGRAEDPAFGSSLLVSAAEVIYRYGRPDKNDRMVSLLREALQLEGRNQRAELLLERVLRQASRWDDLVQALERFAQETKARDEKIAAWTRLARVLVKKAGAPERAAAAYERVIDLAPGHPEASTFLVDHFTSRQMWDHLVALYEEQLGAGALRGKEEVSGAMLQVAMVHWRMRGKPEAAEPWFDKLRKIDPANAGMLSFFREWCAARGETGRLTAILSDAQRALPEGAERTALAAEVARLVEEGENEQRAVDQWRAVLRQDPHNAAARDALKRLYRQTGSWNALADLLRQQLDRLTADDLAGRLSVLREIAQIYRDEIKSPSALVTILSQIVQLDPSDLDGVRELARAYEALQRWRDLLVVQARQAELETDAAVKAELWRAVARRWLEQFSNVQSAMEAYEKLHAAMPDDLEAVERLTELYGKRRAYRPLFDLLQTRAASMPPGRERSEVWMEMARVAAERLDLGPQAIELYKRVVEEEPTLTFALDALEKQAERDKDFVTVAEVLERRSSTGGDPATRLAVLQKLGGVYSDRLQNAAKAASAWRRVLALQPGHAKALRVLRDGHLASGDYDGLVELYSQSQDWEGLVEVLSGAADKTNDVELKIDLSFRCAGIYIDRLKAPERAFRAYERVLSVAPGNTRAASALIPLYEQDEKWARLPALYEVLFEHTDDMTVRLELLEKLVRVTGQQLQDRVAALGWAIQAFELAPERPDALEAMERAARAADQWPGFVDAVNKRLAALETSAGAARPKKKKKKEAGENGSAQRAEGRRLRGKLAEVYARDAGRLEEAIQTYRSLVEEDDGDDAAVQTLDALLRQTDRREDLRWLFEVRLERANTALKLDLLSEWALLEEEAFGAPDRAVALYRRIVEIVPQHGAALRALGRLLRAQGDPQGAIEVLAIDRDQRQGSERAAREIELARLYLDALGKPEEALQAATRALELAPNDPRAVIVIEELLPAAATRARAAAILEQVYGQTGDHRRQAEVLEVLIVTTAARGDRLALWRQLADVHELKLNDPYSAFDVLARAVAEAPMELPLWDRLSALAARTERVQALVDTIAVAVPPHAATDLPEAVELDLAERAATLLDERLGDPARARPYLERMLARQPSSERAFQRLKQSLTSSESWSELGALYERFIAATADSTRRTELLTEAAVVAEELTGDRAKAMQHYEQILEIEPAHEQAIRALDALYSSQQSWDRLARLLERRLRRAEGDARLEVQQRLGTLLFTRLGDSAGALANLEHVLRERPAASEARQLVEKILDVPELRSRAAMVLEAVYTDRDDVHDLVRVLEIHLEFAVEADERRDILRRVARLRDERLRDDAGALEAYARLLPLDPDDAEARHRVLEIAKRTKAYDRVAGVLTSTAAEAASPLPRAEILMDVARLFDAQLDNRARAEAVYREVLHLAPDDAAIALPACRALERLYAQTDPSRLRDILRTQVRLEDDPEKRRELQGRIGDISETVLEDLQGAIDAWRARVDEDAGDTQALVALDRLYDRTQKWRDLVGVLRAREQQSSDAAERRTYLVRIATTLAEKLADVPEAIAAYRAVIDDFGIDRAALSSLATLYETADRWTDLAETLESDLALADSAGDKLAILGRLGAVQQQRLGDAPAAVATYRQALAIEAGHAGSRAALESLLEDRAVRREVAAILRPLYEADGQNEKLLRVLEIEAEHADSVTERLTIVAQAANVAEGPLADPRRAFALVARGLRDAVAEAELPAWLERAERLVTVTGMHAELVALLRGVVDEIADGELQLDVTIRIAEIARASLGDVVLAKDYYRRALDLRADDRRALVALEALHEQTGAYAELLEIVRRRVDAAESDEERRELLFRQAQLCDEKLRDPEAAIGVYEQIMDFGLDPRAVEALERLYANVGQWEQLISLYERQAAAPGASNERRAALHHALGDVLEKRIHNVDRAFEEYATALEIDSRHPQTVASLEALMADPEHTARAASMLEPIYLARLDWRRVMATLDARLGVSQDPDERRHILRRLSKLHEEQEENYGAALESAAKLLAEDVTDETTWAELERLARVASAEGRLAEVYAAELGKVTPDEESTARLCKRTGELFESLGDRDRALVFYRRAYDFDREAGAEAFAAIDRILRGSGRAADRVALYRESLDYKQDKQDRLDALHAIARIEETELRDDGAAILTYRAALDVEESDGESLEALTRLYERTERWRELADHTRRRAEQSVVAAEQAKLRLSLALLLLRKLGETAASIDELQAVVELQPPDMDGQPVGPVAVLEELLKAPENKARVIDVLRPIYERWDAWSRLIALNEERLAVATDDSERISILRETTVLWEERGRDSNKAFDAMRTAWTLDPEDGHAREHLDRLATVTGRWDDLASAYEAAIAKTDGLTRRELLSAVARLHDQRRDDPRQALDAWERLFALDETDLEPLGEMESLATLLSDWPRLVRILTRKAELLSDEESRASTWRRIGEAKRDMLDDVPGSIDAYERALEIEPESALTIDYLLALFGQRRGAPRLGELYERRIALCAEDEGDLRFDLLVQAAAYYDEELGQRREAIEHLVQALAMRPDETQVLRKLDALYTQERLWPELLDNLRQQARLAREQDVVRGLRKRMAALYALELNDPQAALETYRGVLESGLDEETVAAVRAIGESQDELRADVASILEPVLRAAGRSAEVAAILELRLRSQSEPSDRARTLRQIASIAETELADPERAESALVRALAEEPQDAELHAQIGRLAERMGSPGWQRYAAALQERAGAIFDAAIAADLFVRLGEVARRQLGDARRAADAYLAALERMGDDRTVLAALDALFVELGETRRLADVLERRTSLEGEPAVQAELLFRLGRLQIQEFGKRAQGLSTLRQALEREPGHASTLDAIAALLADDELFEDAFDALSGAYRLLGRGADVAQLYERRVARARTPRERLDARLELARVVEDLTGDKPRAQRSIEAAVSEDPTDLDALAALERLADQNGAWSEAADTLTGALGAARDVAPSTRAELWVRVAGWRMSKLNDPARAEEAYGKALAIDPENLEVLREVEAIQRAPGRERDLVRTLRERARHETDVAIKRDLLRQAKNLADSPLADAALAEGVLRDLIAEDEGDEWALEELTKLRAAVQDDVEVVRLLLRRAELSNDGTAVVSLKREAAAVLVEKVHDTARAVMLYEEILEAAPDDAQAAAALRALYAQGRRYKELARLLQRLVDVATTREARAELRLELATLQAERFKSPDDAIDTLRSILEEEPAQARAVLALSHLYQEAGRDGDLADLMRNQIEVARAANDTRAEVALLTRLADIEEHRLGDMAAAQETYEHVLERDPNDPVALEAVVRIAERRSDWDRAASAAAKLLGLVSDASGVPWALRLVELSDKRGDAAGAEDALQRGLKLDPTSSVIRSMLRQRWEKGERWTELAALLVGDADLIAAAHPEAGVPAAAVVAAPVRAGSIPPPPLVSPFATEQVKLLRAAAEIHRTKRASADEAIALLERASKLVPQDRDLLLSLCDAYNAAHREREAAQALEKVIASFAGRRTKDLAVYHHRLGRALAQLGDRDGALIQFDQAFRIDPGSVAVLKDLGVFAFEGGDLDRAQKTFRALLLQRLDAAAGITKAEVFCYLGDISDKLGDRPKAIQMFERAVENDPSLERARKRLAELKA